MGDKGGALRDLKEIAAELAEKGRQADAIEVLREAAQLTPDDDEIRERLLEVYFAAGDFARARECATTVAQFKTLAAALDAKGHPDEALQALRDAARPRSRATPSSRRTWRAPSSRAATWRRPPNTSPSKPPATIRGCCSRSPRSSCAADRSTKASRSRAGCSTRIRRAGRRSRCSAGPSPSRRPTPASASSSSPPTAPWRSRTGRRPRRRCRSSSRACPNHIRR